MSENSTQPHIQKCRLVLLPCVCCFVNMEGMKNSLYFLMLVLLTAFFTGCGSGHEKIEIKGDAQAVRMAQTMMDTLGGLQRWAKIKSVYIRTFNYESAKDENYVLEEWLDLDRPRVYNRQVKDGTFEIKILDGNDGWVIHGGKIDLLPSSSITNLLDWHEHFLMTVLKDLAIGGENCELKLNGQNRFDLYRNGKFLGGFELNENNYPVRYFEVLSRSLNVSMIITRWGEYKGYKYPLEIHPQLVLAIYKTDYWNPSEEEADKAFNISFDPNIALQKMQ